LAPTIVTPLLLQGARVGRCHSFPSLHTIAFAMGTHARLDCAAPTAVPAGGSNQRGSQRQQGKSLADGDNSKDCQYASMPNELIHQVLQACVSWSEGRAGELAGVVRLLGGGMMKVRGSA